MFANTRKAWAYRLAAAVVIFVIIAIATIH